MDDVFTARVKAAAGAAWWTVLIVGVYLTLAWLAWMALLGMQPSWLMRLWGDVSWEQAKMLMFIFVGVFKLILWMLIIMAIFLSIWAHRLKRISGK